jgi:hypothetical protein
MSSVEFRSATGKYFASMASTPKLQAQLREATNAIYLGKGGQPGEYDKDKFEDALQEAAGQTKGADGELYGGITTYKNKALVLPTSIPQEDFEDLVEKAPVQAFSDFRTGEIPLDPNGKPLDVDLLRDQGNIRLVQSAGGRARLFFVVNGSEFEATNSAGGSIEINLNNFSPEFAESIRSVEAIDEGMGRSEKSVTVEGVTLLKIPSLGIDIETEERTLRAGGTPETGYFSELRKRFPERFKTQPKPGKSTEQEKTVEDFRMLASRPFVLEAHPYHGWFQRLLNQRSE